MTRKLPRAYGKTFNSASDAADWLNELATSIGTILSVHMAFCPISPDRTTDALEVLAIIETTVEVDMPGATMGPRLYE